MKYNEETVRKFHEAASGNLVGGVLDKSSRGDMKLLFLERAQIKKNNKNFYAVENVDSLAQSILDVGLKQPLEVVKEKGSTYRLLSGERRLTAIDYLIAQGKWEQAFIPCVATDFKNITLPLSDEEKEMYSIITTNKEQRERTDGEIAREIEELTGIFEKLKAQGVERLKRADGTEVSLAGMRRREFIAGALGISHGKVGEIEKVQRHGSEKLFEGMTEGRISSKTAAEIANLPRGEQDAFIDKMKEEKDGEKITQRDVASYQYKKKKSALKDLSPEGRIKTSKGYPLSSEVWKEDTGEIAKLLSSVKVILPEADELKYLNLLKELIELFEKNQSE